MGPSVPPTDAVRDDFRPERGINASGHRRGRQQRLKRDTVGPPLVGFIPVRAGAAPRSRALTAPPRFPDPSPRKHASAREIASLPQATSRRRVGLRRGRVACPAQAHVSLPLSSPWARALRLRIRVRAPAPTLLLAPASPLVQSPTSRRAIGAGAGSSSRASRSAVASAFDPAGVRPSLVLPRDLDDAVSARIVPATKAAPRLKAGLATPAPPGFWRI
jgi:hypothetical protein